MMLQFQGLPIFRKREIPDITYRIGVLFLLLLLLTISGCGKRPITGDPRKAPANGAAIVNTARSQIGAKYKAGGNSPATGFDCSGFVYWTYSRHGVTVPRTSQEQARAGNRVSRNQLQPGDLIIFTISARAGLHTGIYSGRGNFIHSPSSGKNVREESINSSYWSKRFTAGRRVL